MNPTFVSVRSLAGANFAARIGKAVASRRTAYKPALARRMVVAVAPAVMLLSVSVGAEPHHHVDRHGKLVHKAPSLTVRQDRFENETFYRSRRFQGVAQNQEAAFYLLCQHRPGAVPMCTLNYMLDSFDPRIHGAAFRLQLLKNGSDKRSVRMELLGAPQQVLAGIWRSAYIGDLSLDDLEWIATAKSLDARAFPIDWVLSPFLGHVRLFRKKMAIEEKKRRRSRDR